MNKTEASARIAAIRAELSQLEEIVSAPEKLPGLWMPGRREVFYTLESTGGIWATKYDDDRSDEKRFAHGNCFPSREIAEKAAPLMARANKIISAALQADPGAGAVSGHYVYLDSGVWIASNCEGSSITGRIAYVHTREQAEEMARLLNVEGVR